MIRVAVVDDEIQQNNLIRELLCDYGRERGETISVTSFADGLALLQDYVAFDLIFMDIEMPYLNGIECAKKLRETDPYVLLIFITRIAQYAVRGYEVDALDFMVKPVSRAAFYLKMDKAMGRLALAEKAGRLIIRANRMDVILDRKDILYIEGANQYVIYHTKEKEYRVSTSLKKAEEEVGSTFARCSHSYIVNLNHVRTILLKDVVLTNGETLPLSRSLKNDFFDQVNRFVGGMTT
ncbi:MAG: response regulator transcription factor [Lachnospiraceae bacterium]|nr:response regulator transcription factor [Lachnospiraceae bacterium]